MRVRGVCVCVCEREREERDSARARAIPPGHTQCPPFITAPPSPSLSSAPIVTPFPRHRAASPSRATTAFMAAPRLRPARGEAAAAAVPWTWYKMVSRASGAVAVLETAPAMPPAARSLADSRRSEAGVGGGSSSSGSPSSGSSSPSSSPSSPPPSPPPSPPSLSRSSWAWTALPASPTAADAGPPPAARPQPAPSGRRPPTPPMPDDRGPIHRRTAAGSRPPVPGDGSRRGGPKTPAVRPDGPASACEPCRPPCAWWWCPLCGGRSIARSRWSPKSSAAAAISGSSRSAAHRISTRQKPRKGERGRLGESECRASCANALKSSPAPQRPQTLRHARTVCLWEFLPGPRGRKRWVACALVS